MRRLLTLGVALAVALLAATPASAATFRSCREAGVIECARITVPLDRSGEVSGEVPLHVERVRALGGRSTGAIFALAGGPGQAASPLTEGFGFTLESALDTRDLVVFDQRGTGRSGALSCLTLDGPDEGLDIGSAVAGCAQELGPRRAFYTTQDSADDIETVRRELGVERIALYGTSYGTKVALAYADRYPEHVERMVLDSVVEPDGPDPLSREALEAVPRVLRELCRRGCEGVTDDPARDVAALVARLAAGPLKGYRVDPQGRREPAELRREEVLAFLIAADFLPQVRTVFPGAVRGALAGDLAPLLRLVGAARGQAPEPEPPEAFSQALYLATICEDVSFPYDRDALPEERTRQARQAVERMPDDAFFPFDRETALRIGLVELCASWPSSGRELDDVSTDDAISEAPTLLLSGEEDLRTPVESAQRTASRLPGASMLSVPSVGHSVLGVAFDLCPGRQLERFFTGGETGGRCPDELPFGPVRPPAPLSLTQVASPRGVPGRRGRTLTATALTLDDTLLTGILTAVATDDPTVIVGGGLRSGRFRLSIVRPPDGLFGQPAQVRLTLDRVGYVPGVRVSGSLRLAPNLGLNGRVRVTGSAASPARLSVRPIRDGYRLSGRVDGRTVSARVRTGGI